MGLENSNSNKTFVKKVTIGEVPLWGVQKKIDGTWKTDKTYSSVSGYLVDIKKDEYEYKGEMQKTFEMHLKDGDMLYIVGINYSYMSRSILNSLSPLKDFTKGKIKLSIYKKNDFDTCYVTVDEDRTEWELSPKDLPNKDKDAKRYEDSFDYFIDKIKVTLGNNGLETSDIDELDKKDDKKTDDLPF